MDIDKTCNVDKNFEEQFTQNCENKNKCEIEYSESFFLISDSCKKKINSYHFYVSTYCTGWNNVILDFFIFF